MNNCSTSTPTIATSSTSSSISTGNYTKSLFKALKLTTLSSIFTNTGPFLIEIFFFVSNL